MAGEKIPGCLFQLTLGIFLDFSKAFDRINHDIMLEKLHCYGFHGTVLALIRSYLSNRTQCVSINRQLSSAMNVRNGVPQGSILGPLLFNIFINDIVRVDSSVEYVIYADDTSIFVSGETADDPIVSANEILNKIYAWTVANSLHINCSKSKAVLFRAKSKSFETSHEPILNNVEIKLSQTVKNLGVHFHEHMAWNHHTEHISHKLCKVLGVMRRCQNILPVKQKS